MIEFTEQLALLERDGFAVIKSALPEDVLQPLIEQIEDVQERCQRTSAGIRNLLKLSPWIKEFAVSGMASGIAETILDRGAHPVRAILFNKTPATNWYVTWHQDLSIPVKQRADVPGYGPWSMKDGIPHVQPPMSVLEKMVSLRIHIDPCPADNGAIKFLPGSHCAGILDSTQIGEWRLKESVLCSAEIGDVIVMRPLVLHSSSESTALAQRRVLHIEYANVELSSLLEWAEA
jgi:hypothetical protein